MCRDSTDAAGQGRRELSTPLRQVPVTPQTASELLRLALRPADADSDADSDAGEEHEEPLVRRDRLGHDGLWVQEREGLLGCDEGLVCRPASRGRKPLRLQEGGVKGRVDGSPKGWAGQCMWNFKLCMGTT